MGQLLVQLDPAELQVQPGQAGIGDAGGRVPDAGELQFRGGVDGQAGERGEHRQGAFRLGGVAGQFGLETRALRLQRQHGVLIGRPLPERFARICAFDLQAVQLAGEDLVPLAREQDAQVHFVHQAVQLDAPAVQVQAPDGVVQLGAVPAAAAIDGLREQEPGMILELGAGVEHKREVRQAGGIGGVRLIAGGAVRTQGELVGVVRDGFLRIQVHLVEPVELLEMAGLPGCFPAGFQRERRPAE